MHVWKVIKGYSRSRVGSKFRLTVDDPNPLISSTELLQAFQSNKSIIFPSILQHSAPNTFIKNCLIKLSNHQKFHKNLKAHKKRFLLE